MLSCREVVEQASEYLDQEMSWRRRLQYRVHLLMCHHCRRFTRQFAAGVTMLSRLSKRSDDHQAQIHKIQQQLESLD